MKFKKRFSSMIPFWAKFEPKNEQWWQIPFLSKINSNLAQIHPTDEFYWKFYKSMVYKRKNNVKYFHYFLFKGNFWVTKVSRPIMSYWVKFYSYNALFGGLVAIWRCKSTFWTRKMNIWHVPPFFRWDITENSPLLNKWVSTTQYLP